VLSDGDNRRLVSRRRDNGAHAVSTGGEPTSDGDYDVALSIRGIIDTLEEGEVLRVRDGGGGERGDGFDDDVSVSDDLALGVEGLRVGEVRLGSIGERAELDALRLERDAEGRVGGDGVEVSRALELG
jgi:hypothetical protein